MPKGFAPTRSGSHRLVCRSLYRALLASCKTITPKAASGSDTLSSRLQHLVRFRFRHDRRLQNPKRIRDSLEYGRNSLQLLHAASHGSKSALAEMIEALRGAHKLATSLSVAKQHCDKDKTGYAEHVQKKRAYIEKVRDPSTYVSPKPGSIPILSRPVDLSRIKSQKRRYPAMVVTQGIPFLRYRRQQPYLLSLYIRSRYQRAEKWWSVVIEMDAMIPFAELEDKWDQELRARHSVDDNDNDQDLNQPDEHGDVVKWDTEFIKTKRNAMLKIHADDRKKMVWGRKLYRIMVAERKMALKERQEEKEKRRQQRQQQRHEQDPVSTD